MRKRRQDYVFLGAFPFKGYELKVLADFDQLLEFQLPLALKASSGRNRQVYGPFKVTLRTQPTGETSKEKRKKRIK